MKFLIATLLVSGVLVGVAQSAPAPKYFVCKYVGTPGVNEILQTGNNPISVSGNALTPPIVIGGYFNDAQGRSYVVAQDTRQPEPTCPVPQTPVVPPVTPPADNGKTDTGECTGNEKAGRCVDKPVVEQPQEALAPFQGK